MINLGEIEIDNAKTSKYKESLAKLTREEINAISDNAAEMLQVTYQFQKVGEVHYMGYPVEIVISTTKAKREYCFAGMFTILPQLETRAPKLCFFIDDIVAVANEYGLNNVKDVLPILAAHELQHYRQSLLGVVEFMDHHEVDADSVAIADNGGDINSYEKFMIMGKWVSERVSKLQGGSAAEISLVQIKMNNRRIRALQDWKHETVLPCETATYAAITEMICPIIEEACNKGSDKGQLQNATDKAHKVIDWVNAHPAKVFVLSQVATCAIGFGIKVLVKHLSSTSRK